MSPDRRPSGHTHANTPAPDATSAGGSPALRMAVVIELRIAAGSGLLGLAGTEGHAKRQHSDVVLDSRTEAVEQRVDSFDDG